jgi:hypothetical protein
MKKLLSSIVVLFYIFYSVISVVLAVNTDERSAPWTREKAAHLAKITLFNPSKQTIDTLYAA